jgi:hypothetical protein
MCLLTAAFKAASPCTFPSQNMLSADCGSFVGCLDSFLERRKANFELIPWREGTSRLPAI